MAERIRISLDTMRRISSGELTVKEAAVEHRCSPTLIYGRLKAAGVVYPRAKLEQRPYGKTVKRIGQLHARGLGNADIGRRLGVSRARVSYVLKHLLKVSESCPTNGIEGTEGSRSRARSTRRSR